MFASSDFGTLTKVETTFLVVPPKVKINYFGHMSRYVSCTHWGSSEWMTGAHMICPTHLHRIFENRGLARS